MWLARRFVTSVPTRTSSYQLVPDDLPSLPIRFRRPDIRTGTLVRTRKPAGTGLLHLYMHGITSWKLSARELSGTALYSKNLLAVVESCKTPHARRRSLVICNCQITFS